jgi:hypothetical protein
MTVLAIQEETRLWIGCDSTGLVKHDGMLIRLDGEQKKIFPVGKHVIYCDGNRVLIEQLMETFITETEGTIAELQFLASAFFREYVRQNPDHYGPEGNFALHEIVVASSEEQGTLLYTLSPERNFEISIQIIGEGNSTVYVSGYKHDHAGVMAEILRLRDEDMFRVFEGTFSEIACERVGGCLTAYQINAGYSPEQFLEVDITPKIGGQSYANRL